MDSYQQQPSATSQALTDSISSTIRQIQTNVNQLKRSVDLIGTENDTERVREEVTKLGHESKDLVSKANLSLKKLSQQSQNSTLSDGRQTRAQVERLRNDLIVVMNNLQAAQRTAAQKEKASIQRAKENALVAGGSVAQASNPFDDAFADQPRETVQTEFSTTQQRQIEKNVDLEAMQQRQLAIQQLENDIVDINQIFKDLAVMVHDQGDMVDNIADNVEQASVYVEQGAGQVSAALSYQRAARKKKICLALFAIVIIIIVIIVIWATSK